MAENQVAEVKQKLVDQVITSIEKDVETGLIIPEGYPMVNAVKDAYLGMLKDNKNDLSNIDQTSIATSLRQMVAMELLPSKTQCYFINMGGKMTMLPSYMGMQAYAKSIANVDEFNAQVVLKGEKVETRINEYGYEVLVSHTGRNRFQDEKGIQLDDIVGVYSVAIWLNENGSIKRADYEFMDIQDVQKSWSKGRAGTKTHHDHPVPMVKKSVLHRHTKRIANTTRNTELTSLQNQKMATMQELYDADVEAQEKEELVNVPDEAFTKTIDAEDIFEHEETTGEVKEEVKNEVKNEADPF